jgi:hypothetical protein
MFKVIQKDRTKYNNFKTEFVNKFNSISKEYGFISTLLESKNLDLSIKNNDSFEDNPFYYAQVLHQMGCSYTNEQWMYGNNLINIFFEDTKTQIQHYLKEFTLTDWKQHGISWRNKHFYQKRKEEGVNVAKLWDVIFNKKDLVTIWKVTPTYAAGKKKTLTYDTKGNPTNGKYYSLIILFVGLLNELTDWYNMNFKEKFKQVTYWLDNWDGVKFYSNDPSFLVQGAWKRLDDLDSSVYPFPNLPDTGVWGRRHDNSGFYLTKHFLNLFDILKFNTSEIIKGIDKELKKL